MMDFPGHFDQIFQQLNYQRVHGQLCDCVIVVGNRHFKAHRSVLAACSTHFRALFTVTEGDSSMSMIELDSEVVTAQAFSALIDMMYTSTLMLGESNVMDVLLAASHLHLNAVVKACKHYLTTRTLPLAANTTSAVQPQQHLPHQLRHAEVVGGGGSNGASEMNGGNPSSRLQRSFLLQQLGLSLVNSALSSSSGLGEEVRESGGELRASFPSRRLHKRKPNLPLMGSDAERARQRLRNTSSADGQLCGQAASGGHAGVSGSMATQSGLLSPDSHTKLGEDSKPDIVAGVSALDSMASSGAGDYSRRSASQEDQQMPSQSDCGRSSTDGGGAEPLGKEEYMDADGEPERRLHGGRQEVKEGEDDKMQVVVKSEPVSSPEPHDAVSDGISPLEGAEPCVEKSELSPASESSYSTPQPSTEQLQHESEREGTEETQGSDGLEPGSPGFRISSFLSGRSLGDEVMSSGATSSNERRFLLGASDGLNSSPSSSLLVPAQHLLQGEAGGFGEAQAEALFLRQVHDGEPLGLQRASGPAGSTGALSHDFQRTSLGLHSVPRPPRAHITGSNLGYPGYRRIAPKTALGGPQHQDPSSSSGPSSSGGALLLNGAAGVAGGFEGGSGLPGHPQLTRASADVLSKCKKALSEHNVLVVEGARKYACKICCKTFLTLTDCKKHIRVHTGEKPYACLKCGKRFSQSSHLYKHSKTTCLRWQNSNNTML